MLGTTVLGLLYYWDRKGGDLKGKVRAGTELACQLCFTQSSARSYGPHMQVCIWFGLACIHMAHKAVLDLM